MSSSRISICLINTRSSGNENIFAPLFLPFESGDEVIVVDVLQKLTADPLLHILCGFEALRSQALDVGGNIDTPHISAGRKPRLIDPPFRNDAIAVEPFIQF